VRAGTCLSTFRIERSAASLVGAAVAWPGLPLTRPRRQGQPRCPSRLRSSNASVVSACWNGSGSVFALSGYQSKPFLSNPFSRRRLNGECGGLLKERFRGDSDMPRDDCNAAARVCARACRPGGRGLRRRGRHRRVGPRRAQGEAAPSRQGYKQHVKDSSVLTLLEFRIIGSAGGKWRRYISTWRHGHGGGPVPPCSKALEGEGPCGP
jgi:hypothetical protein